MAEAAEKRRAERAQVREAARNMADLSFTSSLGSPVREKALGTVGHSTPRREWREPDSDDDLEAEEYVQLRTDIHAKVQEVEALMERERQLQARQERRRKETPAKASSWGPNVKGIPAPRLAPEMEGHLMTGGLEEIPRKANSYVRAGPLKVPEYKSGEDWNTFIQDFSEVRTVIGWSDEEALMYLRQSMPEEARRLLRGRQIDAYQEACRALASKYGPKLTRTQAMETFAIIQQQKGEDFDCLAGRIRDALGEYGARITLTHADREIMAMEKFTQALADERIRDKLYMCARTCETLDELVEEACAWERLGRRKVEPLSKLRGLEDECAIANPLVEQLTTGFNKLASQLEEMQGRLAEMEKRSRKPRVNEERITCWNCGEKGHRTYRCPKPKVGDGFTRKPADWDSRRRKAMPSTPLDPEAPAWTGQEN